MSFVACSRDLTSNSILDLKPSSEAKTKFETILWAENKNTNELETTKIRIPIYSIVWIDSIADHFVKVRLLTGEKGYIKTNHLSSKIYDSNSEADSTLYYLIHKAATINSKGVKLWDAPDNRKETPYMTKKGDKVVILADSIVANEYYFKLGAQSGWIGWCHSDWVNLN